MDLTLQQVYDKIGIILILIALGYISLVREYLDNISTDNMILDIGCGNGKNVFYRKDLNIKGVDFSKVLLDIVKQKGGCVSYGLLQDIPHLDETFNNFICIAAYHHLDNDNDRKKSLQEMYRILKPGGTGLVSVWAMEQEDESPFNFTKENEMVSWKCRTDGNTYYRYYHIYKKDQLREEVIKLEPRFCITREEYDKGNWYIYLKKN